MFWTRIKHRVKRIAVKYARIGIIEKPPKKWRQDDIKDFLMAFHYCPDSKEYRYDRAYDPLSKSALFICGRCGQHYRYDDVFGCIFFKLQECIKVARQTSHNNDVLALIKAKWYIFFGLGKHLPDHRDGKTVGELEWKARSSFLFVLLYITPRQ